MAASVGSQRRGDQFRGLDRVPDLIATLERLHSEMRSAHVARADDLAWVHPTHRQDAANLVDYLVLRHHDIRSVQVALAELGLSSLGRAEEHVIATVERVLAALYLIAGRSESRCTESAVGFGAGRRALETHAEALLGPNRPGRSTRILVTMPTEAAHDLELVRALIEKGMGCARVNGAHDGPADWKGMVHNIHRAADDLGQACPILVDLPGPKLRTGPIEPGPRVLRVRPHRDSLGRPIRAGRAQIVAADCPGIQSGRPTITVDGQWLKRLRTGDVIRLLDTRGRRRCLLVTGVAAGWADVDAWDTTYLVPGTELIAPRGDRTEVGPLPPLEQSLRLYVDDVVTLTAGARPTPASRAGRMQIGCTFPAALDALREGHRVLFDDGKIGGAVVATRPGEADIRILLSRPRGTKLRAGKGINMPDTRLRLPAFGSADQPLLQFVIDHADLVGLSFANRVEDIRSVRDRLSGRTASLGFLLKIETATGFAALPELLLAAMESERVGVMVARGDLAVECGFERLAELQEEILWLCDAAHLPVIWATQVLDQMARSGLPSRAEVSDAVMGGRAECVMLNKGPHIVETVTALDDILRRMSSHQQKKVPLLRQLHSWSTDEE